MTRQVEVLRRVGAGFVFAAVLLLGAGCQGAGRGAAPSDTVDAGAGNRPWRAGTPDMQASIRNLVAMAPKTTGAGRIELGRRIVSFGEPATPILVDALSDPDPAMRGQAAWLLGFMKDPRTADALARTASDEDKLVRYEASSALLQIGDPRGLNGVIAGLSDADPRIRQKCIVVLEAHTGETMGFRADDRPAERSAAIARWRAWAGRQAGCR
jgi:hypothetical protein